MPITAGPLAYFSPAPALAGNRLFVIGEQPRAQLQRFDPKAQQFVPFLDGISGGEIDFSRDGKWAAYVGYPDSELWRSRSDGSEKLQLTYAPMTISMPRWSPDGKQISFACFVPGKPPETCWSPGWRRRERGNSNRRRPLARRSAMVAGWQVAALRPLPARRSSARTRRHFSVAQFDLQTKKMTTFAGSEGMLGPRWSPDGRYISTFSADTKKVLLMDVSTGKKSEMASGKSSVSQLVAGQQVCVLRRFGRRWPGDRPSIHRNAQKGARRITQKHFTREHGGRALALERGRPQRVPSDHARRRQPRTVFPRVTAAIGPFSRSRWQTPS